MELNCVDIEYKSQSDKFYVVPIGDIHLGNIGCDKHRLKKLVEWISAKDNCYWIGMGDYIDAINISDKRFDAETVDPKYDIKDLGSIVTHQRNDIMKILLPIKDKCIGLHRGNHEEKIRKRYHTDIVYEMCESWKIPELRDAAITRLRFIMPNGHSNTFDLLSFHGNIGGRRGGNKVNRIEDILGYFDVDICLMAHAHKKVTTTLTKAYMSRKEPYSLMTKKCIGGVTGSFLGGYQTSQQSYIETGMYPPSDLGTLKVTIRPFDKDLHISS